MDPETNQIAIYETPDGKIRIEVRFEDENLWLSQKLMAELFGVNVRTINEHLQNIFKSNELQENSVIRKFRITAADGKNYTTKFYSLEAIIAVGYRVNSDRGRQFRIWATERLKEYILKGYAIDTDRFKYGSRLLYIKHPKCQTLSGILSWSHYTEQLARNGQNHENIEDVVG
jgi:hypothetical protein